MLTLLLPLSLACLLSAALADLVPVAPGPGDIFYTGSNCTIVWDVDTTGTWKNVSIDLMTGPNNAMIFVTNVVTGLDGTSNSLTPYDWTCPDVDPHSAIYFYQFTNGRNTSNAQWTTRFTIASPSGAPTSPDNATQPNGDAIPWGTGRLASNSSGSSVGVEVLATSAASSYTVSSLVAEQAASTTTSAVSTSPTDPSTDVPEVDHKETRMHTRIRHATKTDEASAQEKSDSTPFAGPTGSTAYETTETRPPSSDDSHSPAVTLILPNAAQATPDIRLPSSMGRTMISSGQRQTQPYTALALLSTLILL